MALKVQNLDDKRYSIIVEESRKRIPVHTEKWTDYNVHDPGITFLELLSWITEMQIYHLDQITEKHRLKYLKLLGIKPAPQRISSVYITFQSSSEGPIKIEKGERITPLEESDPKMFFETSRDLTITNSNINKIISEYSHTREDHTEANKAQGMHFLAFGAMAKEGSCLYIGFDKDPFPSGLETLDLILRYYEENLPPVASHGEEKTTVETSAAVVWEHLQKYEDNWSWGELELKEADNTSTLNRSGLVVLKKPESSIEPKMLFKQADELYWIRCRVVKDGYDIPPQIDSILINTVKAEQRATVEGEVLKRLDNLDFEKGTSSGLPNQRFAFENKPIIDAQIIVGGDEWEKVDDFDGSTPIDYHCVLSRQEGEITFGNGIKGKIPDSGLEIKADRYSFGGGERGNIATNLTWKFENKKLKDANGDNVTANNYYKGTGGSDAETFNSALARLKRDLKIPYSAVTLEDCQYIATHTPGLRFGMAKAIVQEGAEDSDGCQGFYKIKVVVVPYSTASKPYPTPGFIDAIRRHLCKHRLLTNYVVVKGPKYVGIGVRTHIKIKPGYSEEVQKKKIEKELKNFLHPLKGGEGREGWPFGRSVYRSEIYELLENIESVDCVLSVSLKATDEAKGVSEEGDIEINEDALVYSTEHLIRISASKEKFCRE